MIPKIIHYCWFGGKQKPDDVMNYIEGWKQKLPDYQIIEWNETNYSIFESNNYVREAYESEKWAFVSDYVRLFALYQLGGIYLDTDVEVFKSFDDLLNNDFFMGFESNDYVATAVIGSNKECYMIKKFMQCYNNRHFVNANGTLDTNTTNVMILTEALVEEGLVLNGKTQYLKSGVVLKQNCFAPNDFCNVFGKYKTTSYVYHHCLASWYNNKSCTKNKRFLGRLRHYFLGLARNYLGTDKLSKLKHGN